MNHDQPCPFLGCVCALLGMGQADAQPELKAKEGVPARVAIQIFSLSVSRGPRLFAIPEHGDYVVCWREDDESLTLTAVPKSQAQR
jgi:hypothetical protein